MWQYGSMDEEMLLVPELDDVPEDDSAEPEDADVLHLATPEEVGDTDPPVEVHDHAVGDET